jgi:hypothetical protein
MQPMGKATFRFYEELNDFLPGHRRKKDFTVEIAGERSAWDMIEALGVPHEKVDLVLANGAPVDFDYIVRDGDRFSVYPVFESFNIKGITQLRDGPLRKTRFIAGPSLGDVVEKIRLFGFDTYYDPLLSDLELIEISNRENRIILTRDKELLECETVTRAIYVWPGPTDEQVNRILEQLDITDQEAGL